MERKMLKEVFDRLEGQTFDILDLLELISYLTEPDNVDDTFPNLHVLVKIVLEKFKALEAVQSEARVKCLD